tara:strand:- start:157 stop:294 length:138 start_codon:yes stop_codon:yes gene_type:complete
VRSDGLTLHLAYTAATAPTCRRIASSNRTPQNFGEFAEKVLGKEP